MGQFTIPTANEESHLRGREHEEEENSRERWERAIANVDFTILFKFSPILENPLRGQFSEQLLHMICSDRLAGMCAFLHYNYCVSNFL